MAIRPSFRRLSGLRHWTLLFAVAVIVALVVGTGCFADGDSGAVRGRVIEVVDRDIIEIETLRIRDDDGKLWTFTTEGNLGKNGSHLRLHQLQGESVLVAWERRGSWLVAVQLRD